MDKTKAIELLKQELTKIPQLRQLHYDDQQYKLWRDKVETIIQASLESEDAKRFSSSIGSVKMRGFFSDGVYQQEYLEKLDKYETSLKSIIQKYEILGIPETSESTTALADKPKVFVSHGNGEGALLTLERFLNELGVQPIIAKDQPNLDRTVDKKVEDCLSEADFVIILATGDDKVESKLQPRQNVIHEIGLAQKTHAGKIIYLLEEGAEFPSNIGPKVYESFARQSMDKAFIAIVREMRKLGFLKAVKPKGEE